MERKLLVLYGSQTGTAQDVAERIGREAKRFYLATRVLAMDDYPICDLVHESLLVVVCSTTGQGEEPDNMKCSWRFLLRRSLPPNSLRGTLFSVLGLGDSSYPQFNFAAKKMHRRLLQLGGQELIKPGFADDQHDLGADAVVSLWVDHLWERVTEIMPLPSGMEPLGKDFLPEPKYLAVFVGSDGSTPIINGGNVTVNSDETSDVNCQTQKGTRDIKPTSINPFHAPLLENVRMTHPSHFQDVRLIRFGICDSGISFLPGDVLLVQPQNLRENVESFFSLFPALDPDKRFILRSTDKNVPLPPETLLPKVCSILECVTCYWDIQSLPRRYFFEVMSHFAEDEREKEKLVEFTSPEGQEELYSYCNRPRRNILEVLYDFQDTASRVPFNYFFDLIPSIKPRAFSIASAMKAYPEEVHLLVAVVQYRTVLHVPRRGLCSTWLSRLQPGHRVALWARKGTFHFSSLGSEKNLLSTPTIMIGPGTGCAPFRAYIQHCISLGLPSPKLVMFFGCRSKHKDYFFEQEWEPLVQSGRLKLFCAFSRDQEEKIYVQHCIREQAELLWCLVDKEEASVYLAGNAKQMPQDVEEALRYAFETKGSVTKDESEKYLNRLMNRKRFQTETWS